MNKRNEADLLAIFLSPHSQPLRKAFWKHAKQSIMFCDTKAAEDPKKVLRKAVGSSFIVALSSSFASTKLNLAFFHLRSLRHQEPRHDSRYEDHGARNAERREVDATESVA